MRRGFIAQAHHRMEPKSVSCGESLKAHVCDLTVRHRDPGAIHGANARGAEAHFHDRSYSVTHLQSIPYVHGLIGDQGDTCNDVFQSFLSCERNRNATHTEPSECSSQINAEVVESEQQTREKD